MPSPIGHALAGILTAWVADLVPGERASRVKSPQSPWFEQVGNGLTLTCAALAAAPDVDLLFAGHRTMTHSVGAVVAVGIVVAIVAARLRRPVRRIAAMCAAAYASHLLLDWMAIDRTSPRGLQILWPFSHRWLISGWNVFPATERQHIFTGAVIRLNGVTIAQEAAILAPLIVVVWLIRVKTFSRLASKMSCRHQAPQ